MPKNEENAAEAQDLDATIYCHRPTVIIDKEKYYNMKKRLVELSDENYDLKNQLLAKTRELEAANAKLEAANSKLEAANAKSA